MRGNLFIWTRRNIGIKEGIFKEGKESEPDLSPGDKLGPVKVLGQLVKAERGRTMHPRRMKSDDFGLADPSNSNSTELTPSLLFR